MEQVLEENSLPLLTLDNINRTLINKKVAINYIGVNVTGEIVSILEDADTYQIYIRFISPTTIRWNFTDHKDVTAYINKSTGDRFVNVTLLEN